MTERNARLTAHRRPRRHVGLFAVVALIWATSAACAEQVRQAVEDEIEHSTQGTFSSLPDPLPAGQPGDIIRSERLLGAPNGATAWRVLYHSTDLHGNDIGVSGTVVVPNGPAPEGGRPVVSWAHPTTGSQPQCGPSVMTDPFLLMEGSHELLDAGYVIAATDYSGMGADGPNSYLLGSTEGRNVLDAVRAARNLGDDAGAGTDVLLWGHSQGGQAVLFAAQIAGEYAPELEVHGVAAAAPAAELGPLMVDHMDDISGVTIGAYAFDAYLQAYASTTPGLTLDNVLTADARAALPTMVPYCLLTQSKEIHDIGEPLVGNFFLGDPTTIEPWATLLRENTAGQSPIGVPVLIAQGEADKLVVPTTTEQYVQQLCADGEHVQFHTYADIDHGLVGWRALPAVLPFFAELMAGTTPADTCGSIPPIEPMTPPGSTPPGSTPPGSTPPGSTPPGSTPPGSTLGATRGTTPQPIPTP